MKTLKTIFLLIICCTTFQVTAQSGLIGRLAGIKSTAEANLSILNQDSKVSEANKKAANIAFVELKAAVDQLIYQLIGDMQLYDGIFSNRTLRKLKKVDNHIKGFTSSGYDKRTEIYIKLFDQVETKEKAFLSGLESSPGKLHIDAVDAFELPDFEFLIETFDRIRDENEKKKETMIEILEIMQLEYPSENK